MISAVLSSSMINVFHLINVFYEHVLDHTLKASVAEVEFTSPPLESFEIYPVSVCSHTCFRIYLDCSQKVTGRHKKPLETWRQILVSILEKWHPWSLSERWHPWSLNHHIPSKRLYSSAQRTTGCCIAQLIVNVFR